MLNYSVIEIPYKVVSFLPTVPISRGARINSGPLDSWKVRKRPAPLRGGPHHYHPHLFLSYLFSSPYIALIPPQVVFWTGTLPASQLQ